MINKGKSPLSLKNNSRFFAAEYRGFSCTRKKLVQGFCNLSLLGFPVQNRFVQLPK